MLQKDMRLTSLSGGSLRVTIPAGKAIRGTETETPIKGCIIVSNAANTRVRIGSACADINGIALPNGSPLYLDNLGDLSLLYFYGASGSETIDILYLV